MRPYPLLAVLLLGILVGLTPVAYAFPPDPSWLPGFYDDDDYDDVIAKVSSAVATVNVLPLYEAAPVVVPVASLVLRNDGSPSVLPASPYQIRGPPSI
jgi:hypothetical protein